MKSRGFSLAEAVIGVVISTAVVLVTLQAASLVKKGIDSKAYVSAYKEAFAVSSMIREMISKSGVLFESLKIPQCLLTFRNPVNGTVSVPFGPVAIFKPAQTPDINSAQLAVVWNTVPLYESSFFYARTELRRISSSTISTFGALADISFNLGVYNVLPAFYFKYAFLFRFKDSIIPGKYPPFCQLAVVSSGGGSALEILSATSSGGTNFYEGQSVFLGSGNNFSWLYGGATANGAPSGSTMRNNIRIARDATTSGIEFLNDDEFSSTGTSVEYTSAAPYLLYNKSGLYAPSYGMLSAGSAHVDSIYVDVNNSGGLYVGNLISGTARRIAPSVVSLQAQYGIVSSPGNLDWYSPTSFNTLLRSPLLKVGNIDLVRFAVLVRANYDRTFNSPVPRWMGGNFPMANFPSETGDRANWRHWRYVVAEMVVPIRNRYVNVGYSARDN
ncbi:hypothetical protein [Candidatus Ichthyocystis hellenicum]|uniref:hypothetical protein n=1 Tax=Candidatus Ichthyocystis hellenicum TaxID=1561003 RepID=UPI000B82396E|nr:hypothetical protein [Candidatus Ichthyocystis hellenicum]